jgi:hypothetical protein
MKSLRPLPTCAVGCVGYPVHRFAQPLRRVAGSVAERVACGWNLDLDAFITLARPTRLSFAGNT